MWVSTYVGMLPSIYSNWHHKSMFLKVSSAVGGMLARKQADHTDPADKTDLYK